MSYRLNAATFNAWKRRGYLLAESIPGIRSEIYGVDAWAPGCMDFRLHLIVQDYEVKVVQVLQAPVKPKHLWREITELCGYRDWPGLPAPWFRGKVLQLLREVTREGSKQAQRRRAAANRS